MQSFKNDKLDQLPQTPKYSITHSISLAQIKGRARAEAKAREEAEARARSEHAEAEAAARAAALSNNGGNRGKAETEAGIRVVDERHRRTRAGSQPVDDAGISVHQGVRQMSVITGCGISQDPRANYDSPLH